MKEYPSRMVATPVVPEPMKGSRITAVGGAIRRTRYCISARGLTVVWSFVMSVSP